MKLGMVLFIVMVGVLVLQLAWNVWIDLQVLQQWREYERTRDRDSVPQAKSARAADREFSSQIPDDGLEAGLELEL